MTDQSFLQPDAVKQDQSTENKNDGGEKDEKELLKILSKRVDDGQAYIKEQAKILEAQAKVIEKYANIEERIKELQAAKDKEQTTDGENTTSQIDPEQLLKQAEERIEQKLALKEAEKFKQDNWTLVTTELTNRYGDKVDEVVKQLAAENDMTFEEAIALAKNKPKIFLNLFPKSTSTPTRSSTSSVRTEGFNQVKADKLPKLDPNSIKSMTDYYKALEKQFTNRS